jgi:opacity protein-like surface antigen
MTLRSILVAAVVAAALVFAASAATAAQPVVEIIALGHWPVRNALGPVRAMLGKYDGRIRVVELDAESEDGERRLNAVGLKGHIPIVVLIDGKHRFQRADGTAVAFVNFPAAASNPMGLNGAWTAADLEAALQERLQQR